MNTDVSQKALSSLDDTPSSPFILRQLDVFNWGPFGGRHSAEIDSYGSAIIGPTGSGKTSLIDALMTLLTAQPKYNLASTGGHESDRDLMSYIRGVSGAGNDSGDNSHVARPGKTLTGISARFSNGANCMQIAALLWVDSASFAASDRKDIWIMTERDDQSLDNWLSVHHEGGVRALKQYAREIAKLQVFDTRKAYLAQLRRFFEVGENAFTLLNRAAGLKQLNSIDEIFRELVLDDRSAFERATEVAKEFDDLAAIRNELEIARKQQQSLFPVEQSYREYRETEANLSDQQELLRILPIWFALAGYQRWSEKVASLERETANLTQKLWRTEEEAKQQQSQADHLKEIYLQLGGSRVEQLKEQILTQQKLAEERRRQANDYQKLTHSLGCDTALTPEALRANQKWAVQQTEVLKAEAELKQNDVYALGAKHSQYQQHVRELREEISKIEARPGSNIPSQFQDFRTDLAAALHQDEEQLPFVAELIEVKPEEASWRGAIERAIGGHRLRLLVPSKQMQPALSWVNNRHNRLHVRLLEASANVESAAFWPDGYTRKLNFKPHAVRDALKQFLASIDRHCVSSAEILRDTPHAMTAQGLMSAAPGRFEKQDQTPLDKGWLTGFDNKDRLGHLREELKDAERQFDISRTAMQTEIQRLEHLKQQLSLLSRLIELEFERVNLPEAESVLAALHERLATLTDPNSSVGQSRQQYEQIAEALEQLRQRLSQLKTEEGGLNEQLKTARDNQQQAFKRIGDGLNDAQVTLAQQLSKLDRLALNELDATERAEREKQEKLRDRLEAKRVELSKNLVRLMSLAKAADTGALNEVGTELQDIPAYLERLKLLTEEALPEKLDRFLAYLNQSSDQGVTQLLADIENEVSIIEERINDLNRTLQRVDYQHECFLQLVPQRVVHDSLRKLESAQKHLRVASFKDDQGESHYHALENLVGLLRDAAENKRTLGARALLDPRYRLQFTVHIVERHSGYIKEKRAGSQGGSGGEKEITASYILTASLSYALCPEGSARPLFGTIILDEAFSKSSQVVAGRIISALREFGLHPLFVTPNKEMRLLRDHTRSAILVHRKGLQSSLTSLSWEELEAHAQRKLHKSDEVALAR